MGIYEEIERKYHFVLPAEYRLMERSGWIDPESDDETYLWLPEMEWMTPLDILDHEPEDYHRPGYVPFAFTGTGDHWCWWPAEDPEAVVLCPHDEMMGVFFAPTFVGAVYRNILDYAARGLDRPDEPEARERLTSWARRLKVCFPEEWTATLLALSKSPLVENLSGCGFMTEARYEEILREHLPFARRDQEFRWMED